MKYDPNEIGQARRRESERYHSDPIRRKRFAYEWFMKNEDSRYWQMTVEYVNRIQKKMTAIAVTSAVIAIAALLLAIIALL